MLIAFKVYGDYGKWKEILKSNPGIEGKPQRGNGVKIRCSNEKFDWKPQGLPHLIKSGETLGTISQDKYGTSKKWKTIWDNNKPLIKDPNLILQALLFTMCPLVRSLLLLH